MTVFKCKMCGGSLVPDGDGFGICDSCGTRQSLEEQGNSSVSGFSRFISDYQSVYETDKMNETIVPLIKRAFIFAEDRNWQSADDYCERIFDINPEYAPAYLCKLLVEYRVTSPEFLAELSDDFSISGNCQKALRYGDNVMKSELEKYLAQAKSNSENRETQERFRYAVTKMNHAVSQMDFDEAYQLFMQLGNYRNSAALAENCAEKSEEKRKESVYYNAQWAEQENTEQSLIDAVSFYSSISGYMDSAQRAEMCQEKLNLLNTKRKAKSTAKYIALAVFIVAKLVCSSIWASYLTPSAVKDDMGIKGWLNLLFHVFGLMPVEFVLTSVVSLIAAACRYKNTRLGGIIMLVLTVIESFMMSAIRNPQIFGEKYLKIFAFYFVFSIICNFTVYLLMLLAAKIKKSLTK